MSKSKKKKAAAKRKKICKKNRSTRPEVLQLGSVTSPTIDPDISDNVTEIDAHFYPYDENLLERARTQWQFGDWQSLAELDHDILQHHPDRAKLALLAAAGHMQLGDTNAARQFTRLAKDWGCKVKLISQVLIAGVVNTLGRAAAINGQEQRAIGFFENSITVGTPGTDVRLITRARIETQLKQLGLPQGYGLVQRTTKPCYKLGETPLYLGNAGDLLEEALKLAPEDPSLLIAYAEKAMRQELYAEAVRRWQHLGAVLGEDMLQPYYDRLNEAYQKLKSFPTGTPEEEGLLGDRDKYEILDDIHQKLQPKFYLEIGVQTGKSLVLAKCRSLGIDPMPQLKYPLSEQACVIKTTSDQFFAMQADVQLKEPPDLVFIDGMHLMEYALRDFINVERYASSSTLVVIDDIYPCHPAQTERHRRTRAWTGDVWKLLAILEEYRPDLLLQTLNAYPTGLLLVVGLDSSSQVLSQHFNEIVARYKNINNLPVSIIGRNGAWSCYDARFKQMIEKVSIAQIIQQKSKSLIKELRLVTESPQVTSDKTNW